MFKPFLTRESHGNRAVLGVVVARRYAGYACIDGFGLVQPISSSPFGTWCLRNARTANEIISAVEARVARVIARCRPAMVVIAANREVGLEKRLVEAAIRACRASATRFVLAAACDGLAALGWRPGRSRVDAVRMLCRHFVPELREVLRRRSLGRARLLAPRAPWRYRRTAWFAAALALRELARLHPWSAVALVRDRPPRCPLLDDLERAVLLTDPVGMTTTAI